MSEMYDPLTWLVEWPHDKISIADAWTAVHSRFGFAARQGNQLETGLVMLISQTQQIKDRQLTFDDLLSFLEKNGCLSLGQLVKIFSDLFTVPKDLKDALDTAVLRRNYLMHHLYRHRASLFETPDGCEKLKSEIVSIQDDMSTALEYLKDWKDATFGSTSDEDAWDKINENVEQWKHEQGQMLNAILGKKNRI
ncbi:hypothetical protein H8D64_02465 [PVC group bacterium]|nr:hypothetical protein [PVC group bacterium]